MHDLARRQAARLDRHGQADPGVGPRDRGAPAPARRPALPGHHARLLTRQRHPRLRRRQDGSALGHEDRSASPDPRGPSRLGLHRRLFAGRNDHRQWELRLVVPSRSRLASAGMEGPGAVRVEALGCRLGRPQAHRDRVGATPVARLRARRQVPRLRDRNGGAAVRPLVRGSRPGRDEPPLRRHFRRLRARRRRDHQRQPRPYGQAHRASRPARRNGRRPVPSSR